MTLTITVPHASSVVHRILEQREQNWTDHAGRPDFRISTSVGKRDPGTITAGLDGNLWFTESAVDKIGRITPAGAITEFPIPTASSFPSGIATGPDGYVWFTENDFNANNVARITP